MASKSIKIKNYSNIQEEFTATAVAITPGMLLELTSAGTVQAHSTSGGNVLPMFALENELEGDGINDAYDASGKIQVWIPQRGDIVEAILVDGETVAIGGFVESNGDGYVKAYVADSETASSNEAVAITVYPLQIIGQAIEAVDLSSSSGEESSGPLAYNKRIKIRII